MNPERRRALRAALAATAMLAVPLAACTGRILPRLARDETPGFRHFYALCLVLTASDALDEAVARRIHALILEEPWGPEHIERVYRRVAQQMEGPGAAAGLRAEELPPGERWFVSHLLLTWYTGVYFHDRGNQVVTLDQALMYRKSGFLHAPTYCGGAPGHWALPPDGVPA